MKTVDEPLAYAAHAVWRFAEHADIEPYGNLVKKYGSDEAQRLVFAHLVLKKATSEARQDAGDRALFMHLMWSKS